jgi:protein-S-isoprenylcysteine O-methyltransferase Ste14
MKDIAISSPVLIILAVLVYGLLHSLLASLGVKSLARRWFGPLVDRFYRLGYNIFASLSLLPILALPALLPDQTLYIVPYPWILMTAAIQGLAILGLIIGLLQTGPWSFFGLQQLSRPQPVAAQKLIIRGLYRWVRHPLYTTSLILIWLTPIMTVNLLALIVGLSLYLVIGAHVEERKLALEFGQTYREYQKRTPMLIPGPFRKMNVEDETT